MIIDISEKKIVELILDNRIGIEDINSNERTTFLKNNGSSLLLHYFKQHISSKIEKLLYYQPIEDLFIKEVRSFNSLSEINYLEQLPENSFLTPFIWYMSKQNSFEKNEFFEKIYPLVIKYKEDFKKFFNIRLGEEKSSFTKGQPIGLFFLRVFDRDIDSLLDKGVISLDLFSPITKDTLAHYMNQYSVEVNKSIIQRVKNNEDFFKDKNNLQHTGIDKLISDLKERNIATLEYLFTEVLDLDNYQNEFTNYVIKSANIFNNAQTAKSLKDRLAISLNVLFNLPQLQSNVSFKEKLAKIISSKGCSEIHYLWLQAKLPEKGIEEKRLKI